MYTEAVTRSRFESQAALGGFERGVDGASRSGRENARKINDNLGAASNSRQEVAAVRRVFQEDTKLRVGAGKDLRFHAAIQTTGEEPGGIDHRAGAVRTGNTEANRNKQPAA